MHSFLGSSANTYKLASRLKWYQAVSKGRPCVNPIFEMSKQNCFIALECALLQLWKNYNSLIKRAGNIFLHLKYEILPTSVKELESVILWFIQSASVAEILGLLCCPEEENVLPY